MNYKTVAPKDAQYIDYRELQPFQGDLKDLSAENYDKLLKSIQEDGFFVPVFVWKHKDINYLLDGHGRKRVLDNEKIEFENTGFEIPCYYIPGNDYKQAKKRLLKITSQYQTITQEGIDSYIAEAELDEAEVYEATAFDANIGKYEEEPEVEEDEAPEVDESEPPKSKLGEIYQLGRHRVMCGDSTDKASVELLMAGEKADMVYADPPYGMNLDADYSKMNSKLEFVKDKHLKSKTGNKYANVIGDHADFDPKFISVLLEIGESCREVFLWGADYYAELLPNKNDGSWFVWDKRLDESSDKMYGSTFELVWSKSKHKRSIVRIKWAGVFGTEQEFDRKRHHPTQKPIKLSCYFIENYSDKEDKIIDLFLGSGSTLIACEQTDRTCYGMELDPKYVDVIRKRYAKFTAPDDELPENWEELTPAIARGKHDA